MLATKKECAARPRPHNLNLTSVSKNMQRNVGGLLAEASAAATIGIGLIALRSLRKPEAVEVESLHTKHFGSSPFNRMIQNLRGLGQPDMLQEFVATGEQFLDTVQKYKTGTIGGHAQFVANRLGALMPDCRAYDRRAKSSRSIDVIDAAVVCQTEEAPHHGNAQNMLLEDRR